MKTAVATALSAICATIALTAQGRGPAAGPPPRPAISTYVPQVGDLDKAERFYHQLLGLESAQGDPRSRLTWYPTRPFLIDMYGVEGQIRNFIVRVPTADLQVEPIQWSEAKGKPLNPRLQDSGATRLILAVSNLDMLVDRLKQGGAKVITAGGKPVMVADAGGMSRSIVFEDGNGFYVELVQHATLPARNGDGSPLPYIYNGDVTVTVADLDKSATFLRDVLGLEVKADASAHADPAHLDALGMKGTQYREAMVMWPEKTPRLHLVEFSGLDRKPIAPLVADPNSVLIRTNVRDNIETTLAKAKAFPDAKIMNRSGAPFVNGPNGWLIVRLPGASTYMQLIGPLAGPAQ